MFQRLMVSSGRGCRGQAGVGMLELLFALLVFTTALGGVISAQLAGKRAGHDALQRSMATALASDVLTRMRANPTQLAAYQLPMDSVVSFPEHNCDIVKCATAQLAEFDLWQWQEWLRGAPERYRQENTGGLLHPRASIKTEGAAVTVLISWCSVLVRGGRAQPQCNDSKAEQDDGTGPGALDRRRQVLISTYIQGH